MNKKILSAGFIALILVVGGVLADNSDVGSSASITNAAPTVGTVAATDPVTLTESGTVTVQCNATITDNNGYGDVSSVSAKLWDPAATTEGGSDDSEKHYTNSSCPLTGGSGTTVDAKCSFTVQYYANPAEWTCKLTATDGSSATGSGQNTAVTVSELKALSTDGSIALGELALGATSASDVNITVTNTGNIAMNVSVDGYGTSDGDGRAMTCSIGTGHISVGNLKYSLTAGTAYGSMTSLTDSAVTLDFNLAKRTQSAASTKNVCHKLQMPASNAGGSCTGHIIVTAV